MTLVQNFPFAAIMLCLAGGAVCCALKSRAAMAVGTGLNAAVAVMMMYLLLFFAGGLIISKVEGLPLIACLFETASALGTVGLSLGITVKTGIVSRLVLIALMFLGRVGGLTLIYAAQTGRRITGSTLPLEKVTVG